MHLWFSQKTRQKCRRACRTLCSITPTLRKATSRYGTICLFVVFSCPGDTSDASVQKVCLGIHVSVWSKSQMDLSWDRHCAVCRRIVYVTPRSAWRRLDSWRFRSTCCQPDNSYSTSTKNNSPSSSPNTKSFGRCAFRALKLIWKKNSISLSTSKMNKRSVLHVRMFTFRRTLWQRAMGSPAPGLRPWISKSFRTVVWSISQTSRATSSWHQRLCRRWPTGKAVCLQEVFLSRAASCWSRCREAHLFWGEASRSSLCEKHAKKACFIVFFWQISKWSFSFQASGSQHEETAGSLHRHHRFLQSG